jgi:hypothetical protein
MSATKQKKTIDWPVWWFVRLEAAVEKGDHIAAAEAQRQLDRLGVRVAYGIPKASRERGMGHVAESPH